MRTIPKRQFAPRPLALLALASAALALAPGTALSQDTWPSRPIRLILVQSPGGGVDIVGRSVAQKLQEALNQSVVVENRPGGSEIVGTQALARSQADGYTFGIVTNTFAINPSLYAKLPYDSLKDFSPVTKLVDNPFVLLVGASAPVNSVTELVNMAKSRPGKLNYAHVGPGSPHFLAGEWFKRVAGIDVVAVGYKGAADAMRGVAADEALFIFTGIGAGMAQVKAGRLKALAVTPARRLISEPNLPSVAESGYSNFDLNTWHGLLAPAGTPAAIVSRLNAEVTRALKSEDLAKRLDALGAQAAPMSPEEFSALIRADIQYWGNIVRVSGAKAE